MYNDFSSVYDLFMDNVPYEEWAKQTISVLKGEGILEGLVCELGCGTGTITEILANNGYDMIGIDNSIEMLNVAGEKKFESGSDILYLCQDMREFELYGTVRAFISRCDSLNYLTEYEELVSVFKLVNNYLDPKGVFIFDMNTLYKYKNILGNNTFAENRDDASFIWENTFFDDENINEYDLTLFIRDEEYKYTKSYERHIQRAFTNEEVLSAIKEAGMEFVSAMDVDTDLDILHTTQRALYIARENGK